MTPAPEHPDSDEALLTAAQQGSERAFEALYHRHKDWVLRVATRFTPDRDEALDVVQEVFHGLLRALPRLKLTAQLRTYLYPAVRHTSVRLREKRARLGIGRSAPEPSRETPAPGAERDELAGALGILSDEQREALMLRYVDGLGVAEIAALTGVPEGTVKSRLHFGLEKLRQDPRARRYFGKL